MSFRSSLLLALAVLPVLGCRSTDSSADAPLELVSDPATTGLVALECRMENRSTFGREELELEGGSVRRIETGQRWYIRQREGLLIFDGLPPGTYVADYLKAGPWTSEARAAGRTDVEHRSRSYHLPYAPGFEFLVEPGRPTFFGPMTARNARRRGDVWVDLNEEPEAEHRAWRTILKLFPESAWAPAVRARLVELE
jgi:hypothetical protein